MNTAYKIMSFDEDLIIYWKFFEARFQLMFKM